MQRKEMLLLQTLESRDMVGEVELNVDCSLREAELSMRFRASKKNIRLSSE
jgi:hypothetical protein